VTFAGTRKATSFFGMETGSRTRSSSPKMAIAAHVICRPLHGLETGGSRSPGCKPGAIVFWSANARIDPRLGCDEAECACNGAPDAAGTDAVVRFVDDVVMWRERRVTARSSRRCGRRSPPPAARAPSRNRSVLRDRGHTFAFLRRPFGEIASG
jgi:hypothetical protein